MPAASAPNRRTAVALAGPCFPRWVPGEDKWPSYRAFLLIVGHLRPPSEGSSEAAWKPVVGRDARDLVSRALARIPPADRLFVDRHPFGETGPIKAKVLDGGHLAEMRLYLEGFECEMRGDSLVIRYETRPVGGTLAYSTLPSGSGSGSSASDGASDGDGDDAASEDLAVSAADESLECCSDSNSDAGDDDDSGLVEADDQESEAVWCTGTIPYRSPAKQDSAENVWGSPVTESLKTQVEKVVVGILGARVKFEVDSLYEPLDFADGTSMSPAAFVVHAHVSRDAPLCRGNPF